MISDELLQRAICNRLGSPYVPAKRHQKVGVTFNVQENVYPINGLRNPVVGDTSGWYIWAGEKFGDSDDFFTPLHIDHLDEWCPSVIKYLGLAPGWRFLLAPGQEDIWFDPSLLTHD